MNSATHGTVTILPTTRAYVMCGRWTGVKEVANNCRTLADAMRCRAHTTETYATQAEALAAADLLAL